MLRLFRVNCVSLFLQIWENYSQLIIETTNHQVFVSAVSFVSVEGISEPFEVVGRD